MDVFLRPSPSASRGIVLECLRLEASRLLLDSLEGVDA